MSENVGKCKRILADDVGGCTRRLENVREFVGELWRLSEGVGGHVGRFLRVSVDFRVCRITLDNVRYCRIMSENVG
jgi:hypothetical protein